MMSETTSTLTLLKTIVLEINVVHNNASFKEKAETHYLKGISGEKCNH